MFSVPRTQFPSDCGHDPSYEKLDGVSTLPSMLKSLSSESEVTSYVYAKEASCGHLVRTRPDIHAAQCILISKKARVHAMQKRKAKSKRSEMNKKLNSNRT